MALKGSLKDFPVSDIFQLIGQQQKSGSLFIKTNQKQARIVFDEGKVLLCTFLESDDQFLIGTMMVNAKAITKSQLQEAILIQKSTSKSIGDTLIQMKQITPQILAEFIRLQIDEVLFQVFQWTDGFFEFIPEKVKFNKSILESQSAEGVLMDSFRKKDEWPRIQKIIDHTNYILVPMDKSDPASLNATEKKVFSLFDGKKTLLEVVQLSRLGTFETCKIASELLTRKLIQKAHIQHPSSQVASGPMGFWLWTKVNIVPASLMLAMAILLPTLAINQPTPDMRSFQPQISIRGLQRINQSMQWETKVKGYFLDHGQYPTSFEDFSPELSMDRFWMYEKTVGGYKLTTQWTEP